MSRYLYTITYSQSSNPEEKLTHNIEEGYDPSRILSQFRHLKGEDVIVYRVTRKPLPSQETNQSQT